MSGLFNINSRKFGLGLSGSVFFFLDVEVFNIDRRPNHLIILRSIPLAGIFAHFGQSTAAPRSLSVSLHPYAYLYIYLKQRVMGFVLTCC